MAMRIVVEVERVPGLGYFARVQVASGIQLMPVSAEDEPTNVVTFWADSVLTVNAEAKKVEALGHDCDIVHVMV
jgi:hypothetical protein